MTSWPSNLKLRFSIRSPLALPFVDIKLKVEFQYRVTKVLGDIDYVDIKMRVVSSISLSYIYLYSTYYKNSHGIHRFLSSIYAVII